MLLGELRNVRAISQKWKYEKRLLHTHSKEYLLHLLQHYGDMNYHAVGCLAIGANEAGVSYFFANSCASVSSDAIRTIRDALEHGNYRTASYVDPVS